MIFSKVKDCMQKVILGLVKSYQEHRIFFWFATVGVLLRMFFWLYTGRIWEDALITLTPALNVWDGFGLTHHPSEPRVHSFTSPISVLIPIIGVGLGDGLLALRLTSLVAFVGAIWFAYSIGCLLRFNQWAHVLVLGYLAIDQQQIFFGMSGMETQVATTIILGGVYYLLAERWRSLGLMCGLAALARPEFLLFIGLVAFWLLIYKRNKVLSVAVYFLAIALPWVLFVLSYYGSIVPNTIAAKTWSGKVGLFSAGHERIIEYLGHWWQHIAPFKQWSSVYKAPLPDAILLLVVSIMAFLFLIATIKIIIKKEDQMMVVVLAVGGFFAYRTLSTINPYFMWYLPPFMALFFLVSAYGLTIISKLKMSLVNLPLGATLSISILFAYGLHIPFSFPYEKMIQTEIDDGVRREIGKRLDELMSKDDAVFLEPLGYIGIEIRGKTTYDFPGLSSPKVVNVIKELPQVRMGGVIERLSPEYVVLRPNELTEFKVHYPIAFEKYHLLEHFKASDRMKWDVGSYARYPWDTDFVLLKRVK
jgi:hypothetical protein